MTKRERLNKIALNIRDLLEKGGTGSGRYPAGSGQPKGSNGGSSGSIQGDSPEGKDAYGKLSTEQKDKYDKRRMVGDTHEQAMGSALLIQRQREAKQNPETSKGERASLKIEGLSSNVNTSLSNIVTRYVNQTLAEVRRDLGEEPTLFIENFWEDLTNHASVQNALDKINDDQRGDTGIETTIENAIKEYAKTRGVKVA